MTTKSSETSDAKCSQRDSSVSFTGQSNFALSVADAIAAIPGTQWQPSLLSRSRRSVSR